MFKMQTKNHNLTKKMLQKIHSEKNEFDVSKP